MQIPLIEPTSTRYIHVNLVTNRVHLLVPFVGGQDVSTDNTCRSKMELDAFFGGGGVRELKAYKRVLEFHLLLLEEDDDLRNTKEERLAQINTYLEALIGMRDSYQATVNAFLAQPSNLYSIQLRPRVQDPISNVVNSVFTINRGNDFSGTPLSLLYNKMHEVFPRLTLGQSDPHQTTEAHGERDKFFTQKGLICTNFANMAPTIGLNQGYFTEISEEAATHPDVMRPQDEPAVMVNIHSEALMDKLDNIQWDRLPKEVADAYHALPVFQLRQFTDDVAKGQQDEAEAILQSCDDKQTLLTTPARFTDYSGRTFNCTAYEYAYWAKDTHMRRMLERHMDDETKTQMLEKIDAIERSGLAYQQHRVSYQNPHYDMSFVLKNLNSDEFRELKTIVGARSVKLNAATADNYTNIPFTATEYEPLKKALEQHKQYYFSSFFHTLAANTLSNKLQFDFHSLTTALETYVTHSDRLSSHEREMAWLAVGKAQRDVPAHIAREYCRLDRSFQPFPEFSDENLPRNLKFYHYDALRYESWFPLAVSGLGVDCAVMRHSAMRACGGGPRRRWSYEAAIDLAAIRRLDEVRTTDLTQSRENLTLVGRERGFGRLG